MTEPIDWADRLLPLLRTHIAGKALNAEDKVDDSNDYYSIFIGPADLPWTMIVSVSPFYPPTPPEVIELLRVSIRANDGRVLASKLMGESQRVMASVPPAALPYTVEFSFD